MKGANYITATADINLTQKEFVSDVLNISKILGYDKFSSSKIDQAVYMHDFARFYPNSNIKKAAYENISNAKD